MLPNEELVERIWNQSRGEFAFVSTKFDGKWTDWPVTSDQAGLPLDHQPSGYDLFFSALRSSKMWRANDNFGGAALLFADLDPVKPWEVPHKPTIAWETSPGMYQAVWFLDEEIENYNEWSNLNRRMTRYTKADPGGWMGSKALRWPGSLNWKRRRDNLVPAGVLLWDDGPEYARGMLAEELPALDLIETIEDTDHPIVIHESQVPAMLHALRRKHWAHLNPRSKSIITRKRVSDRSLFIYKACHQLIKEGLEPEEVFHLLWVQPYCKWRTDRHAPHVLWSEIQKAVAAL